MKKLSVILILAFSILLTGCNNKPIENSQEVKESLTYSNLVDEESQDEVRKAMESVGISEENIKSFFYEVDTFNSTVEGKTLVNSGFTTIDSFEPDYDLISMMDMWDANNPMFIGYNCRLTTFDLMKDLISIGKPDIENSDWLVFDYNAIEYNPKDLFNEVELDQYKTLFASIPAEDTKDISIHLKNVQEDWANKKIQFPNKDKTSIISVIFHDELGYLFIGHMGFLIPIEDGQLMFIEKLTFHAPYQVIKFNNRTELNDYLMNKYDISWGQPTAKPFIMENDQLLEGYREKPVNEEDNIK